MNKVLTIAVPSYNTEKFIDKNIPTYLKDQRILNELEVLIINDGSKDHTAETAQKYVNAYPDTVRLVNKENGGHGSVINTGIELAQGKYFKVIDGDDWVEEGSLYQLIEVLKNTDADLVINPYHFVYEDTGKRKLVTFEAPVYGDSIPFRNVCNKYQKLPIHAITYKTALLRGNKIKVREHCFYEDNEFDLFPIPFVGTISVLDFPVYEYLMAQKNQSVSDSNSLKNDAMFYNIIKDCISCFETYNAGVSEQVKDYMERTIYELIRSQYNIYLRNGFNNGAYAKYLSFEEDFRKSYSSWHDKTAERYSYVGKMQKGNKAVYAVLSIMIRLYKKLGR